MRRTLPALLPALILFGGALGPASPAVAVAARAATCSPLAAEAALQAQVDPLDTLLVGRIVFVTFPDSRSGLLPAYADSLPTELAAYLAAQSRGRWRTDIRLVRRSDAPDSAWRAPQPAASYAGPNGQHYGVANREVLAQVAVSQPDVWRDVDQVWVIHDQCIFPCTDNSSRDGCEDTCPFGGIATLGVTELDVPGLLGGGTTQRRYARASEARDHAIQSSFAVHEFGHRILSTPHSPGSDAEGVDWVNFGRYDVLRSGVNGADAREEGLLPYSPLQLARWGWLPRLIVDRDTLGLRIGDVMGLRGQLVEIATRSPRQRFVLSAHAASTPYDARYGGAGLLVWHVLRDAAGFDRRWDVESAAGRLRDGVPDPVSGMDPLEADPRALGSFADLFQEGAARVIDHASNPSSRIHELDDFKSPETAWSGVAVERLRRDESSGDLMVDVWVTPAQRLLSPAAGERAAEGQPLVVRWEPRASALITDVGLEWSLDDGATWRPLATALSNSGRWEGPVAGPSERARVRLLSRDSSGVVGVRISERFAIEGPALPTPAALSLSPPAPNPSGGATRFRLTLPTGSRVQVTLIDLSGRRVRTLEAAELPAGTTDLLWDGRDDAGRLVPAGLYVARLRSGAEVVERRVVRVRSSE